MISHLGFVLFRLFRSFVCGSNLVKVRVVDAVYRVFLVKALLGFHNSDRER